MVISLAEGEPWLGQRTPVLSSNLDATGSAAVMAVKVLAAARQSGAESRRTGFWGWRPLRELKCDLAAVAHDLRSNLDQLLSQCRERPVFDLLRQRQCLLRVNNGSPAWALECPVLGAKRKSISGCWTSESSQTQTLGQVSKHELLLKLGPFASGSRLGQAVKGIHENG